jgi:Toprim domain
MSCPMATALRCGPCLSVSETQTDDDERKRKRIAEFAERIWREAHAIAGTAGEAYFNRRGIDLTGVPDFGGLRWHPKCPWERGTTACVVARFTDVITGEPRGIHRRPIDGRKPMTLGPMAGCGIRLWPDEVVTTGLVLGEGVVAAAATRIVHRNTMLSPTWAAGSAGNMRDFPVLDGIEALTLLVDHDVSGTGQKAAAECARRWIDAGRKVECLTPRELGLDFNDIVKGDAA